MGEEEPLYPRSWPVIKNLNPKSPDWPGLHEIAAAQAGHFTTAQAAERGFSEQLLSKHAASGKFERPMRGIYRLGFFPPSDNEDLVVAWLWSGRASVVSHESALQLHGLSDALPARIHLTLPLSERSRRRVVPDVYILHFADLGQAERVWLGPVPLTAPARTVLDVADAHGDANLVAQAVEQGIERKFFRVWDIVPAIRYARSLDAPDEKVFLEAVSDLGGSWVMRAFSGRCLKPPADWPTLACTIVKRYGGRILWQMYRYRGGAMTFHVAWPNPGPGGSSESALRQELGKALAWR